MKPKLIETCNLACLDVLVRHLGRLDAVVRHLACLDAVVRHLGRLDVEWGGTVATIMRLKAAEHY
ncbi:MAG: hypothetical protein ACTH93_08130 [Pseudoclavibacter sp.]